MALDDFGKGEKRPLDFFKSVCFQTLRSLKAEGVMPNTIWKFSSDR